MSQLPGFVQQYMTVTIMKNDEDCVEKHISAYDLSNSLNHCSSGLTALSNRPCLSLLYGLFAIQTTTSMHVIHHTNANDIKNNDNNKHKNRNNNMNLKQRENISG